jgi:two-component system, NtrC family, sensor kinase
MRTLPTLRRELIAAFALVFTGAFLVLSTGVLLLLPQFKSLSDAAMYIGALLILDVGIFTLFGHVLITRRVLEPIARLVSGAEAIATGELAVSLPDEETAEMARLSEALNDMARRLIADQERLAANIRSLDDTNRLLTEARDAMVHSEKLASVGRLGAGIAHEVGNPLAAIIGYLSLLRRKSEGREAELIDAAEREAHRIDRIVRGLLDYSRPHDAKPQPLDVNKIIHDTVDLVSTQGKFRLLRLDVMLAEDLPVVNGDPYQLQQVLVNLFVNAADALEHTPNPMVSVTTVHRAHRPAPSLQARRKDDHPAINYSHRRRLHAAPRTPLGDPGVAGSHVVEIMVSDNGPGIPLDMVDQIFEPFVTSKEIGKGTGLGLAVCSRLIEGMGGIIRADAQDEGGATFRIVLPAEPDGVAVSDGVAVNDSAQASE